MSLSHLVACRRRLGADRESGFTLVELMISVALSLMILAGLVTVFVNNSNTRKEVERTARQIENGRYATDLLANNLTHAGFLAEFDPTVLPAPAAMPEACSTSGADLVSGLALPIQGYRSATSSTTGLGCLVDLKDGTDVVVVRRASTCVAGTTGCDPLTNNAFVYFQASLCNPTIGNAQLASSDVANFYSLSSAIANLTSNARTCTVANCTCTSNPVTGVAPARADIRRYQTHIYYIANNSVGSDGIPTLKRAELVGTGFTVVPLVEGIENMKLEYGIDGNNDGMPDAYTSTPDTYNGCAAAACAVTNWRNVTAGKIFLLAKNTEPSAGYTDSKTYTLDSATTVPASGDRYRRHVYGTTVKLVNVAGRRGI